MGINFYLKNFLKFSSLTFFLYLTLFEANILNKEIKAEKKILAATKAVGVATATYVQVIEGKHGGLIKEIGEEKLQRDKLFSGAEFQIVTTAMQYCPDSVPKDVTKKVKKILKENKK